MTDMHGSGTIQKICKQFWRKSLSQWERYEKVPRYPKRSSSVSHKLFKKKKIGLRKGQRKLTFSGGIGSILWSNGQKSFYKMLTNEEKANNVHMKASPHPACPTYIGINAGSLKGRHQDREGNTIRSALPNYTQVPFHKLTKFHNETHKMFDNW